MNLYLRAAMMADVPLLAEMNRQLIEDEGSRNPMSLAGLEERMRGWLAGGWQADLIMSGKEVFGYAVYQMRKDEYFPETDQVYLRQYFIRREHRGKVYGKTGIGLLLENRFPKGCTVIVDVLAGNTIGQRFWASAGFEVYYMNMRLKH